MSELLKLIRKLPKAELHLHIEGTLEPSMLMALAQKHSIAMPYGSIDEVINAYNFNNLQSFLDLYYLGASVLRDEEDFYHLMIAYLERCHQDGIVHTEMMFDPQTHTTRGIDFSVFMSGFERARHEAAERWKISTQLIMCFLRHLDADSAMATLAAAKPFRHQIVAVGLDSSELGHPPEKFTAVFQEAAKQGYLGVAHAGEEGPPEYIKGALDSLEVARIDHGVRCLQDAVLVDQLVRDQTPLTVCPLSNIRLRVFDRMEDHPVLQMLDRGLNVCINSDDPPYFGGYLMDNFFALEEALSLTEIQARHLVANSIRSSFISSDARETLLKLIRD